MKTLILLTTLALSLCGNVFGQESKTTEILNLGVLNEKAKVLQMPNYPKIQARIAGNVTILVKIELQTGKVIEATIITGNPLLRKSAEEAALKAEFTPILKEFDTTYGTGTLIFKLEDFTGKIVENKKPKPILPLITGGIMNGAAKNLTKPEYTDEAKKACASGKVEINVLSYMATGKIISAKAISGNELLWKSAEDAVMKSEFLVPNIDGDKNVYLKGKIIYNFVPEKECKNKVSFFDLARVASVSV